jgi:sporulation protein YlmC with PRC-barrel domain
VTLFSEATGLQVVSTTTAVTVGKIDEFVVDPNARAVVALKLKKTDTGDTLHWRDITAFGADAVTVPGAEAVTEPDDAVAALSGKDHRIMGKRVLATTGDELGTVADVDFEPDTGIITAIVVGDQTVEGIRLIGVGSYAVVVQAAEPAA